jgi:hypothetical protein
MEVGCGYTEISVDSAEDLSRSSRDSRDSLGSTEGVLEMLSVDNRLLSFG